jgi:cell division protein FtsI/penicillin-binding protein 2
MVLLGCQQSNKSSSSNQSKDKGKIYDVGGTITEVNEKQNRVLVDLTKKVQEHEEQMWITVEENTKISNEQAEAKSFQDLKPNVQLKANLTDMCLEPNPRICFAEEISIE